MSDEVAIAISSNSGSGNGNNGGDIGDKGKSGTRWDTILAVFGSICCAPCMMCAAKEETVEIAAIHGTAALQLQGTELQDENRAANRLVSPPPAMSLVAYAEMSRNQQCLKRSNVCIV